MTDTIHQAIEYWPKANYRTEVSTAPLFPTDEVHPARHERIRAGIISIDHSYQREPNMERVSRMAATWHETGPIQVSKRRGDDWAGQYFVYNGMHRLLAFIQRWGPDAEIDAWVEDLTHHEEAMRFASQYRDSVRVTPTGILRAHVAADDEHAQGVTNLLNAYGIRPQTHIMAVTKFSDLYRADPMILEATVSAMRDAWHGDWSHATHRPISQLYGAIFAFIQAHGADPAYSYRRLTEVLEKTPPRRLVFHANSRSPGRTKPDEGDLYQVLVELYNGERRTRRLTPRKDIRSTKRPTGQDPI